MAIDSKNLVVAAKVYSRGVALPLDASSVYESLVEAQTYAASPIAYAGQIITVLQDGAYKAYVLDDSAGAHTLTPLGSGSEEPVEVKNYVQIVTELPGEGQEQGVIYINTTDNKGYIYNGTDSTGNNVELEREMMDLSKTGTKFLVLSNLEQRQFTHISEAIRGQ